MAHELEATDLQRIEEQLRLLEAARPILPLGRMPYFAHMRVAAGGRERDLLLGRETRTGPGVSVIDWQNAPLAEVFFAHQESEAYEIELDDRTLVGTLVERNLLGFEEGELVEIAGPWGRLSRRVTGAWRREADAYPRLEPRPAARQRSSPVEVELDPAQRLLVELPAGRPLLVLGEAGHGKTTVALHRLASLAAAARAAGAPFRAAVIVPADGLRRLVEISLERLGTEGIEVRLYDRWAADQARRVFRSVPRRESHDATAGVMRLKRHPALRPVLAEMAAALPRNAQVRRSHLEQLFGDGELVERVAERAAGELAPHVVREVLEHSHVQFSRTSEEEHRHVDAERLAAIDGRTLDDGTPTEDAGTIDVEDYAVLFELDRLLSVQRGARARPPTVYDCIVVDEAQELAPIELVLIGRCLGPRGTLIVAGDAEQQVDPGSSFSSWEATMAELGAPDHERGFLKMSYRCPPAVTALARAILAPPSSAAGTPVWSRSEDPSVAFARFEDEFHLSAWLVDAVRRVRIEDPAASIAVIAASAAGARRLVQILRRGLPARLALDGEFELRPGVDVTTVRDVKGLEFDHVIVPDASPASYPSTPAARRALYVATTRAMHQLILATPGAITPLLL